MFKSKYTALTSGLLLAVLSHPVYAEFKDDQLKIVLKNAYIERDFDNPDVKDTGSWSQGISAFYTSGYTDTPLQVGLDLSAQYALRLSKDKGVADTVLPFDKEKQEQERHFLKHGGTLKAKYNDSELRVGELWLHLPVTAVDSSRQLLASYLGLQFNQKVNDELKLELGRVEKFSSRYEEDFSDLSLTLNGETHKSDGLYYLNLKYKPTQDIDLEYYYGYLENIFNKHYLSLNYQNYFDEFKTSSSLRYFYTTETSDSYFDNIDNHNIGLIQRLEYQNHKFSVGYQQISGDNAYPILDGFIPALFFINWNVTGFFKEDEKSWHFIYGYNLKDYVPGLGMAMKYSYGYNINRGDGLETNSENELNLALNYNFQQPALKDFSISYLFADYNVKYGNDFKENRLFLNYVKKF